MKTHRPRTALAVLLALALAAGAGLAVYLYEVGRPAPPPAVRRVWEVSPAYVVSLTLRGADGTVLRLEQDEVHAWHIVAPFSAEADQKRVDWLVDEVAHLEPVERPDPDRVDLARAGLLSPTAVLTIGLRGGGERTMEIGRPGPGGLVYYVRVEGTVYLCAWDVVERVLRLLTIPPLPPGTTPTP
ncbi:MAG: DUF4340 domain-containing protein [Chloroflexia bacterium]